MKIPSQYSFCIACFREFESAGERRRSKEHVILNSLGGLLCAEVLCVGCNNRLGSTLDSEAKNDPRIRAAVEALKEQLPSLHKRYSVGQLYVGASDDGPPIRMSADKRGSLRLLPTKLPDGSLLQDTNETRRSLTRELSKSGRNPLEIEELLTKFDSIPSGTRFELIPGLEFVKREIARIGPDYSGSTPVSESWVAKLAYVHLCLCLTPELLLEHRSYFEPIVNFMFGGPKPCYLEIEDGLARSYRPDHIFGVDCESEETVLRFQLFGAIGIRVKFLQLAIRGVEFPVIVQEVRERRLYVARNWQEFQQREFHVA